MVIKFEKFKPEVSVIVPVYKVSRWIEKCAESIFNQDLENMEILFIDDCSPDNSIEIILKVLEKFPNRKAQTRILTMPKNSGQGAVRRYGILEARGEFLIQCDGDDWIDPTLYSQMLYRIKKSEAEIVFCDFAYEYPNETWIVPCNVIYTDGKKIIENLVTDFPHMSCCNKMIKRSIFIMNDILPWQGLNMWEDNGLMIRALYYCHKVEHVSGVYYHYNKKNEVATTADYGPAQVAQMIEVASRLTNFFYLKDDRARFKETSMLLQFLAKLNLITTSFDGLKKYKNIFPGTEKIAKHLSRQHFSSKGWLRFTMVKNGLAPLFIILYKIYKKVK